MYFWLSGGLLRGYLDQFKPASFALITKCCIQEVSTNRPSFNSWSLIYDIANIVFTEQMLFNSLSTTAHSISKIADVATLDASLTC